MNTQTIDLDLTKEYSGECIKVGQGDASGTTLEATIYDGGTVPTISSYTAYLEALLPDKVHYYRLEGTISGNVVTFVLDESKMCPGYTDECYVTLERGSTRYSTERFALDILKSATAAATPAEGYDSKLEDLITSASAAISSAESAATSANTAAGSANTAATKAANAATSANGAASTANTAATAAESAAARALAIAGSISGGGGGWGDCGCDGEGVHTLARILCDLTDGYIIIGETVYVPPSRVSSHSGETLSLSSSSLSGETATLT